MGVVGDIDFRRHLVGVFDLGLGQRRTAVEAPVHRLDAAREVPALDDLRQRTQHVGFEAEVHAAVGLVPLAQHAQALEVLRLSFDLFGGVFAALGAEGGGVELGADLAVLLFDHQFDRQAVAVPARHVGRVEARKQLRLHHQVLEDLVHRVADVDRTVRIRRAVVQHEQRPAPRVFAHALVQAHLLPRGQHARLALGQVAAHRERRLGQADGVLVVLAASVGHFAHALTPDVSLSWRKARRACRESSSICRTRDGRSSNFSSSRSLATNSTSMRLP